MGKSKFYRLLAIFLTIAIILSLTACQKQPEQLSVDQPLLPLPQGYMTPIEVSHASILMPFILPASNQSEAAFHQAWNAQTTYILDRARAVTDYGHAFHARLLKAVEGLMAVSGQSVERVSPIINQYTLALLQADVLAGLVQGGKIDSVSQQALMSYDWLLASANLSLQAGTAVKQLFKAIPSDKRSPSSPARVKLDPLLMDLLEVHGELQASSRQMVSAHAQLVLTDHVLGSLLDGAVLAKTESAIVKTGKLTADKLLEKKTADGVEEQLESILDGLTAKPSEKVYAARAKGFIETVAAVSNELFSPVDYLADLTTQAVEPVVAPVRNAFQQMYETVDEASGDRISALSDLMLSYAEPLADYLGIPQAQSLEILQSAAMSASELGRMDGPQLQMISDAALVEHEYLDRADVQLQDFLEANGLQLLVQMIGYFQTLENDSDEWLERVYDETVDFLSIPPEEEIDQTRSDIDQLAVLMFGEKPEQSDRDWILSLLGVDFDTINEDILTAGSGWLQTLHSLGQRFAQFLGEDAINLLSSLNDLIMLPVELTEYPIIKMNDAFGWIGRYAGAQQDRMTLALLESLQELYVQLGIMKDPPVNLDDLTEELSQSLQTLVDQKDLIRNLEALTEGELEQALMILREEVSLDVTDQRVRVQLLQQLVFLLELLEPGTSRPTPAVTDQTTQQSTQATVTPTVSSTSRPSPTSSSIAPSEPTAEPAVWIGDWSGAMRVTRIDRPDSYSPSEQEALLNTSFPIAFTVTQADGGAYAITILNNQGGEVHSRIDGRQISIQFRNQLPDGSQTLFQNFKGTLAADNKTVQGEFTTGIESIGSFYSGTWSVLTVK